MRYRKKLHIPMGFYSDPTIWPRLAETAELLHSEWQISSSGQVSAIAATSYQQIH